MYSFNTSFLSLHDRIISRHDSFVNHDVKVFLKKYLQVFHVVIEL
nr:MAG TPA: hypothetical protein [Bacteriophage sp.]